MNIANIQNRVKWAILAVFQNPLKKLVPSKYYLYEGQNNIGSDSTKSEVVIEAEGVSPLHAEIYITNDGDAYIQDLNSKQGIFKKASFNPNKKVRLEQNQRFSIIPDHEFYIGKYKCYVVAFDEDYKKGEERRQRERDEISQSQSQKKYNMTIELDETDLDDVENNNIFADQDQVDQKKYNMNEQKDISNLYEKTLELSDQENQQEEQQLFQNSNKQSAGDYEKTLEIKSDADDQEEGNIFNQNNQSNQKGSEYDKTLELSSNEGDREEENNLFRSKQTKNKNAQSDANNYDKTLELSDKNSDEDNQNLFQSSKKNTNKQMECEKTLQLSDKSDDEEQNIFKNKSQQKKQNDANQYDKTLELSDKSGEEDNDNLFQNKNIQSQKKKNNQQMFEKTLELSDKEQSDNENSLFKNQQNRRNNNKMECEKTLELSDKDDQEDSKLFQKSVNQTEPNQASFNASLPIQTTQSSLPIQASQGLSEKQRRMEILKNNYLYKKYQNQASQPSESSQNNQENKKMIAENQSQSNKKSVQDDKKMIPENDKTPDLSEEEKQQKKEVIKRRENEIKKALSPQPSSKNIQKELLQETLIDEDSFHDDGWFESSTQERSKTQQQRNTNLNLVATLLDSPQSQNQSQSFRYNKKTSPLSPTLVDDDQVSVKSANQSISSQNKVNKKHKSPISLSPTFLDEEVNLNLLSVQNEKQRKLSQQSAQSRSTSNQELGATLIDQTDSNSKINSPLPSEKPAALQNTLIDSPESQNGKREDTQNQELINKIKQQEEELKKLREQLQSQGKAQQNQTDKKKTQNETNDLRQNLNSLNNEQNYVINVLPTLSDNNSKKQDDPQKKAKNINLDKVNQFDDLFGNDEEEEQEENNKNKINSNHQLSSRENSRTGFGNNLKREDSQSGVENSNQGVSGQFQGAQQRNIGLMNKKFPLRTLTMSDMKKSISPIASSTQPSVVEEFEEKAFNKASSTVPQKTLFQSSDVNSSDDQAFSSGNKRGAQQSKNKQNDLKEEKNNSNGDQSEDLGEDPKKKQKVQSSWVQLLKQKTGKMQDENSRNSTKSEDSVSKEQNSQSKGRLTRQSQDKSMVAEDIDGNAIKESMKISVSGFKLKPEQKKGIKQLKSTLIEDNQDFDILVVKETKRTIKLLLAVMKKKPIVHEKWLTDSIRQNKLLSNYSNYQPEESQYFKERFNNDLEFFIQKRKQISHDNQIFEGYTFYISKSITEPNEEELTSLIEAGGGQIRKTLPNKQAKKGEIFVILGPSDLYTYKTVSKLKVVTCIMPESILDAALFSEFKSDKNLIQSEDFFKN
ncbi:BRCT domain protein (macronuclear) [Tetrahymena thermophila SB210]|uniref:BRCT domain protein n=1 Tax=Tetrahymena thermophila (strain SB210) TaxID=312017 RepID=I7M8W3_TETTS|nr:BRCT domain protein [Tetrahymena thermophila SB210]EAR99888.3 BRCT domain protein [Tetrahymena thermophila SB210]|eukprot:XP_001020133.3 BRCT domain protein [Tetrahymena thermophila SB210]